MSNKINIQNVDKLNKKFANAMTKLQAYSGTDPESVVQAAYNKYFTAYFGLSDTDIIRVEKCDSYFTKDDLTVLIEYKFDADFGDLLTRCKVLAQVLFYYKRIIEDKKKRYKIPNAIFIGDVNECFCLKTSFLSKYLDLQGVDYSVAPSSAGEQMVLVNALMADEERQKNVLVINPQKDNMSYICEKLISISQNKEAHIPITKKNIHRVFETFVSKVVNDKKYDANEIVGLFIDAIKHPDKRIIAGDMMVVHPYKPIKVFASKAIALFNFFSKPSDEDCKSLAMIYDTLVKDSDRRKHGFFITPTCWTDLAHRYVADWFEKIGWDRNWEDNDNVVVWDCCCGTKSLTRDYRFKNLYLSTLEEGELNASAELSPEAKETFIFDFLNDPLSKLPESLKTELKNLARDKSKKLVFLTNPPYATAGDRSNTSDASAIKAGCGKSTINSRMLQNDIGLGSREILTQFLFRMSEIAEEFKLGKSQVIVATFSNPMFMCGPSFNKFREFWHARWSYDSGFLFNASEFEGCSNAWGISFSVWNYVKSFNKTEYSHTIYENTNSVVVQNGTKLLYNSDGVETMDEWFRHGVPKPTHTTSGFKNLVVDDKHKVSWNDKYLGLIDSSGSVSQNKYGSITSGPMVTRCGGRITKDNIDKAVQAFSCREVVDMNWLNDKDVYIAPFSTNSNFISDSYCLTTASYVCSIENFKNNFFPFSKAYTYQLLGKQLMKNEVDEKRWCLANGKFDNLTPEGQAVIDAFADCIRASAPYRDEYAKAHPELQLDHWDAGYRQLRDLLKETCKDKELKVFREKLKALKEKMRPVVYELGFLKK